MSSFRVAVVSLVTVSAGLSTAPSGASAVADGLDGRYDSSRSAAVEKRPSPRLTERAYVVAQSGGVASLNLYSDGSMSRLAPVLPTGAGTFGAVMSADRRRMYVAPGAGLGTKYSEGQEPMLESIRVRRDGGLRKIGAPLLFDPSVTPMLGDISADGQDLYFGYGNITAAFVNGGVMHFRISKDGQPTQVDEVPLGLPIDGVPQPRISPDSKWLYVPTYFASAIVRFALNRDGSINPTPVDRVITGAAPINPIFSPDDRFLYVALEHTHQIAGYEIQKDGSLSAVPGSPFLSGSIPHNFVFSEDGTTLYSANTAGSIIAGLQTKEGSISAFDVAEDGSLTPLPGSPYPAQPGAMAVNRSSDGRWLYLTSSPQAGADDDVVLTSYRIRRDGTLNWSRSRSIKTGLHAADGPQLMILPIDPADPLPVSSATIGD